MRKLVLLSCIALLTASTSIARQNAGVVLTREQVDAIVQPLVDDGNAQSIVVGIIDSSGTHVYGYGKISKDVDRAPDGKTVFEIGGVTTTLTGTMMAVMKQDGVINYEDPVQNYLPADVKLEVRDRPITLLDLATHHSGLPVMPDNVTAKDPNGPFADYNEQKLNAFLKSYKPTRAPGAEYLYSNVGIGILGHVLAKHANLSYEQMVHDRVLEPLQMTDTTMTLSESQKSRLAPGHDADGHITPAWTFNDAVAGAGGLRSTCDDLIKFAEAQIHPPDGKLGDAVRETHEARAPITPGREVGLTWMIDAGGICVWHQGDTGGYQSFIACGPEAGVGVIMLANSANGSIVQAGSEVIRAQLGLPGTPPVPPRDPIELTKEQMDRFVGDYQLAPGAVLKIWRKDDKLMAQLADQPAFRIFPESETQCFWKVVDAQVEFELGDDNGPAKSATLHQNGQHMPAARIAAAPQPATKQSKANMTLTEKLASLNITLPPAPKAAGAYIPAKKVGDLIFVSGQLPFKDGKLQAIGQVPSRCTPEVAKAGARQCVLNALAAVSTLPGGIDQITGVARVGAFISSDKEFTQQPSVANGASEFLIELFGDNGRHARAAIATNTLPLDAAVEVEFIFMTK